MFLKVFHNDILKSSFAICLVTFCIKITGYFEKITLAFFFGTTYIIDAYTLVFSIITSTFIFFRELIEPGFLSAFSKAYVSNDSSGAWALFNIVARIVFFLTALLSVGFVFFSGFMVKVFAPGFEGKLETLASDLLKYSFPVVIFLSLSTLTNITLNARKQFVLPILGDLVFKASIVFALVVLVPYIGIYAVVYGFFIGSVLKLILHSVRLYKKYSIRRVILPKAHALEALRLTWPLIIGSAFSQINNIVDNVFASYMGEGVISGLSYAKKVIDLPILLFPYIISIVLFPYFSQLSISNQKDELMELLLRCLSWIVLIFIPLSCFFNVFSYEIIDVMFRRGAFTSLSVQITSVPLAIYSFGLVFFGIETILVIYYFSISNTRTPTIIGIVCVLENIILTYLLIEVIGYTGIAWGLILSKATKVTILLLKLNNQDQPDFKQFYIFLRKTFLASLLPALFFYLYQRIFNFDFSLGFINNIVFLLVGLVGGSVLYTLSLNVLKINKDLLFDVNKC